MICILKVKAKRNLHKLLSCIIPMSHHILLPHHSQLQSGDIKQSLKTAMPQDLNRRPV